jgi:hypothetical protein
MSASNFLAVDTSATYKDIYCNSLATQAVTTGTVTASGTITAAQVNSTDMQVLNHLQIAPIVPLSLTWAGSDQTGIVCSRPSGHVLVQFSGTPLGIGAIARFQLTNAKFGLSNGGSIVSKGPFISVGESLTARLIDVCVSFRAPGALTIAIINNNPSATFAGNVEFDFIQF